MPSRVIREGLLDSQRYWAVNIEAQRLFWHLLLLADDFGLVSLAPVFIRRRCFDDTPSPAKVDKLLEQLADADLLRIYETERGRHAFIPRFGQRLRMMRCKHPAPPEGLLEGDQDAQKLFKENRHLFEKLPAGRRQVADRSRPEVESEGKRREGESKAPAQRDGQRDEHGKGEPFSSLKGKPSDLDAWAVQAGLRRTTDETEEAWRRRVIDAWAKAKATEAARQ